MPLPLSATSLLYCCWYLLYCLRQLIAIIDILLMPRLISFITLRFSLLSHTPLLIADSLSYAFATLLAAIRWYFEGLISFCFDAADYMSPFDSLAEAAMPPLFIIIAIAAAYHYAFHADAFFSPFHWWLLSFARCIIWLRRYCHYISSLSSIFLILLLILFFSFSDTPLFSMAIMPLIYRAYYYTLLYFARWSTRCHYYDWRWCFLLLCFAITLLPDRALRRHFVSIRWFADADAAVAFDYYFIFFRCFSLSFMSCRWCRHCHASMPLSPHYYAAADATGWCW